MDRAAEFRNEQRSLAEARDYLVGLTKPKATAANEALGVLTSAGV